MSAPIPDALKTQFTDEEMLQAFAMAISMENAAKASEGDLYWQVRNAPCHRDGIAFVKAALLAAEIRGAERERETMAAYVDRYLMLETSVGVEHIVGLCAELRDPAIRKGAS